MRASSGPDGDNIGRHHYRMVQGEVTANWGGLDDVDHEMLRRYYRALSGQNMLTAFYSYNWQRRVQPMVRLVQALPRRDRPWQILDAGCGLGTEALLWASLRDDVEVTGVDISAARLQAAAARVPFYEQQVGRSLLMSFYDQSVFTVLKEKSFDLVWNMEAISHIDPAEAFVTAVYANLNPGGKLVISDSHLLNPAMLWRIFKLRRKGIRQTYKTTSAGETISYAEERLFSVPALSRLLRRAGFGITAAQLSVFLPPVLARFRCFATVDRLLNAIPLVRYAGGIYTVVAVKS